MSTKNIQLRDDEEYITLGTLLKIAGIIDTGGQAKFYLAENVVYVDEQEENRRGCKLYHGMKIRVGNQSFLII